MYSLVLKWTLQTKVVGFQSNYNMVQFTAHTFYDQYHCLLLVPVSSTSQI